MAETYSLSHTDEENDPFSLRGEEIRAFSLIGKGRKEGEGGDE